MLNINILQTFMNVLDIDFNHHVHESTTDIITKGVIIKILTIDHDYEMQKKKINRKNIIKQTTLI